VKNSCSKKMRESGVGQDLREEKIQKIEKKRGEQLLEKLVMICCFHSLDYKGATPRFRARSGATVRCSCAGTMK
jgi:predicted GNAT family acetyltransferase